MTEGKTNFTYRESKTKELDLALGLGLTSCTGYGGVCLTQSFPNSNFSVPLTPDGSPRVLESTSFIPRFALGKKGDSFLLGAHQQSYSSFVLTVFCRSRTRHKN